MSEVRRSERLALARDLHDLVTHHISGIVVLAQAAGAAGESPKTLAPIEQAGTDALRAMRHLVGLARDGTAPDPVTSIRDPIAGPAAGDARVRVSLPADIDRTACTPELATTVNRVVMESLTNVRKHAPGATFIDVSVRVRTAPGCRELLVEVVNDGLADGSAASSRLGEARGGGFGLAGIAERVRLLGGTVRVGRDEDGDPPGPGSPHGAVSRGRWRVSVTLPLADAGLPPFLGPASSLGDTRWP